MITQQYYVANTFNGTFLPFLFGVVWFLFFSILPCTLSLNKLYYARTLIHFKLEGQKESGKGWSWFYARKRKVYPATATFLGIVVPAGDIRLRCTQNETLKICNKILVSLVEKTKLIDFPFFSSNMIFSFFKITNF